MSGRDNARIGSDHLMGEIGNGNEKKKEGNLHMPGNGGMDEH